MFQPFPETTSISTMQNMITQQYEPQKIIVSATYKPELFIPSKKVVSFHVFQKLTAFDLAYYVLRL